MPLLTINIHLINLNNYKLPALKELNHLLPENEYHHSQNFATKTLKHHALATKILTRKILAEYTQLAPKDVPILRTELAKPKLAPPFEHIDFNIAHTHTYFALAITENALIGIDVESTDKKTDVLAIAQRFFHPDEYQALLTSQDKTDTFFKIWTQKEAFVKAIGQGLSFGLEKFSVDPVNAKILTLNDPHYQKIQFYSQLWPLPEQHYLCLTANKKLDQVKFLSS